MSFATVEEYLGRLDAAFVTQLTSATPEGGVDNARVQRALDDATAELEGYLPRLPAELRPTANTLRLHCYKVTTYLLTLDRPGKEYEQIRNAYTDTIAFYEKAIAEAKAGAGSPLGVSSEAPCPVFTDRSLKGLVP